MPGEAIPHERYKGKNQANGKSKQSADIESTGLGLAFVAAVSGLHGSKLRASNPGLRVD